MATSRAEQRHLVIADRQTASTTSADDTVSL
jgi:hypothetical protein